MLRLVTVANLVAATLLAVSPATTACGGSNIWTSCETTNTGTSIEVGATVAEPGSSGTNDAGNGGRSEGSDGPSAPSATPPETECPIVGCRGDYEVWTIPDVTLADIASFTPARPTFSGEPAGVAVVGMPANFVASAGTQQLSGELFGYPVTVRFEPREYVFHYGDGARRVSATGGASWPALGQAQFTATPTSHSYSARGVFSVAVTVRYAASVDFGVATRAVPGYVEATTGGYSVQVYDVRTALVERTCLENPTGPGC